MMLMVYMFSSVCFVMFLARKEQNLLAVAYRLVFLVLVLCYFELDVVKVENVCRALLISWTEGDELCWGQQSSNPAHIDLHSDRCVMGWGSAYYTEAASCYF